MEENIKNKSLDSVIWRLLQNFSTMFVSFFLQIWLARLLTPEQYGIIALTSVFVSLSLVFVQTGFTASIIQKTTLKEIEIDSVFYSGIILSIICYFTIYFFAPLIADIFHLPVLSIVLRVQSINIIIASIYSVPLSLIQRDLQLRKTFYASLVSSIIQGIIGIILAYYGFGVWALVLSGLSNSAIYCIILIAVEKWRPHLQFSLSIVFQLIPYSIKILFINFINALFINFRSLIIGKAFNTELLGYYNKGYQIPMLFMTSVDGAINTVNFSMLSKFQNDINVLSHTLRRSLKVSLFFVWPAMIGLTVVAKPLIFILLSAKWLKSVPFVQITAIGCMTWPFSVFLHGLNAIGKSNKALMLNNISKVLALLAMAISFKYGIYVFVFSEIVSNIISTIITIKISFKYFKIKSNDLFKDLYPILFISIIMGVFIYCVSFLCLNIYIQIIAQILVGITIYFILSKIFLKDILQFVILYVHEKINKIIRKN